MEKMYPDRRTVIKVLGAAAATTIVGTSFGNAATGKPCIDEICKPDLGFGKNSLEPVISQNTIENHFNSHHMGYYSSLTAYIDRNDAYKNATLPELLRKTRGGILMDNTVHILSGLLWNHNFYWASLCPKEQSVLPAKNSPLFRAVNAKYGSFENLKNELISKSETIGIGWVWLVDDNGSLEVLWTDYQDTPIFKSVKPLLGIDVWEHAYYMDYGHNRGAYVSALFDNILNWGFAERQLTGK